MKKIRKPFDSDDDSEESGKLSFHKTLRFISISGVITWQLADKFFNILTGFESFKSRKPLAIYINSEGGDAYAMFKIYDHIKNSPLFITTIVAGYAASGGFIIFLAGDCRKIFPRAFLGFHSPINYFSDNDRRSPDESRESDFHQHQLLDAMIKIVKENSNMPEKTIRKYFRILTRIDAKTALKFGLAHQIIYPSKKEQK